MLLTRGDLRRAIVRLKVAHRRGPNYADPLELWGEALLAKGDPGGPAAKFGQAAELSPRWGRLHLK